MQGEDVYVEDSEEEDTWPRLAFAPRETPRENPRVPSRGKDTPRGFKPAPAKYVIKREPASQPRGAPQVQDFSHPHMLQICDVQAESLTRLSPEGLFRVLPEIARETCLGRSG